jgi:release factor glutamine methyltransferase
MKTDSTNNNNEKSALPDEYRQGFAMFCGCKIDLSQRVLIPRPETEFMARYAIQDLTGGGLRAPKVLDIFSGSGCVGVAIAKSVLAASVDLSDINLKAVAQIKINLEINDIDPGRARVFVSDIFGKIPDGAKYDLIIANPPYVDPARIGEVQDSVIDHEPGRALFGGKLGLEIISRFLEEAKNFLVPDGSIYMEFDPQQAPAIGRILDDNGYKRYAFLKDQYGQIRFVKAGI